MNAPFRPPVRCDWEYPYRLVTLLELLETEASAFWRLSSMAGQLMIRLEDQYLKDNVIGIIGETLGGLTRECRNLKLTYSLAALERIREHIEKETATPATLRTKIADLITRIFDELRNQYFISIPVESVGYYRPSAPLFGMDVEQKFVQMSEDIAEAGKCLALSRSTAAVFHLMRVMELAVQRFGTEVGVPFAHEQNWQVILDQINKAIRSMDQKALETKRYAAAASHLYNVKLAWRNEVMHPKQTYTVEEAKDLFDAVRTFTRDLAALI